MYELAGLHCIATQSLEPGGREVLSNTSVLQSFAVKLVDQPDFGSLVECEFVSGEPAYLYPVDRSTDTIGHLLLHAIEA